MSKVYEVEIVQMLRTTKTVRVEADSEWSVKERLNDIYDAVVTDDFDVDCDYDGNNGSHYVRGESEDIETADFKIKKGK